MTNMQSPQFNPQSGAYEIQVPIKITLGKGKKVQIEDFGHTEDGRHIGQAATDAIHRRMLKLTRATAEHSQGGPEEQQATIQQDGYESQTDFEVYGAGSYGS